MLILTGRRARHSLRRAAQLRGLFLETTLFVLLFGLLLSAAQVWVAQRERDQRHLEAGHAVSVLADAARHYLQADYPVLLASIASGREVLVSDLQDEDLLPASFEPRGPLQRDLTVFILPITGLGAVPDGLRMAAGQVDHDGDAAWPAEALVHGGGHRVLGIVAEGSACPAGIAPPCLTGPSLAMSLADFATVWPNRISTGGVFAYHEFRHAAWCGHAVHRIPTPADICPDVNVVARDLDMDGHDILGAGVFTMHDDFALTGSLVVGQTLTSDSIRSGGTAMVTGSLIVDGTTTIDGALNAGTTLTSKTGLRVGAALTVDGDASLGVLRASTVAAGRAQFDDRLTIKYPCTSCP